MQRQRLQGICQIMLRAARTKLRLNSTFFLSGADTFAATMDVPDQGATGVPVDAVTVKDASVRLVFKSLGAVYEGVINKEGTPITENWSQRGMTQPLTLNRGDNARPATLPPQE